MFVKTSSAKVVGFSQKANARTAGRRCVGSFEYEPNTDGNYLYVAARACTADVPNLNYDMLPHDELKTAYESFIGCPVFLNHDNQDTAKARGVIIDAKYHQDDDDKWIEILCEMDEDRCPKLCSLIRNGEIDTMSMGCLVENTTCSICGNVAEYPYEYCDHIQQKGREYQGKLAFEICNGIDFFEESFVYSPADPTAYVQGMDKNAMRKSAKAANTLQLIPWVSKYKDEVIKDYLVTIYGNDIMHDVEFTPEGIDHFNGFVPIVWNTHNTNVLLDQIRDGLELVGVYPLGHVDSNLYDAKYYMDFRGWGKSASASDALTYETWFDGEWHTEDYGVDFQILRDEYDVDCGVKYYVNGIEIISIENMYYEEESHLENDAEWYFEWLSDAVCSDSEARDEGYANVREYVQDTCCEEAINYAFAGCDAMSKYPNTSIWIAPNAVDMLLSLEKTSQWINPAIADRMDYLGKSAQNYSDEPRTPEEVDSKGVDEVCPLCGSDSYDGEECSTCGYSGSPEGFDDIALDFEVEEEDEEEDSFDEVEDDEPIDDESEDADVDDESDDEDNDEEDESDEDDEENGDEDAKLAFA